MNFLNILYREADHDALFTFLKKAFGADVGCVEVDSIVPDSYVTIRWKGLLDPNELASKLTLEVPSVLIECPTNTGIDCFSRYFNKNQLW